MALPRRSSRFVHGVNPRNMVSFASSALRSTIVGVLLSIIVSLLFPRYWLEPGLSAGRERPQVAVPGEADHLHLAGASRARPLGDAPRADVFGMNDRDRVGQPQHVAGIVAHTARRFARETLTPHGGVEGVAELTLEGQRDARGRSFAPEPAPSHPALGRRSFDDKGRQTAAPDQRAVLLAHDREMAERALLIARERAVQPCGRFFRRARPDPKI